MIEVRRSSVVRAPRAQVWARVVTAEGVADEFGPLMSMRFPAALRGAERGAEQGGGYRGDYTAPSITDLPLGKPVGRAWILLGGVIPVEYDDLVIVEVEAPRYFLERSTLGSCKVWEHRRELEELPDGTTRVTDTLRAEPRVALLARAVPMIVGRLFDHRHRRLARAFGEL